MLYRAFLDKDIRSLLSEYAALATISSWDDTTTATEFSVDELYDLAFPQHIPEGSFWVKSLTLGGDPTKLRGGDGQNGCGGDASIFNNNDLELVGFVRAARELQRRQKRRWGLSSSSSFDEALASILKDPRYKGYASKFVTAGLVSIVASDGYHADGVPRLCYL